MMKRGEEHRGGRKKASTTITCENGSTVTETYENRIQWNTPQRVREGSNTKSKPSKSQTPPHTV
jgi:hypothetical protein